MTANKEQIEAYIKWKKETGRWSDEKPKKESKSERIERIKRNAEKRKLFRSNQEQITIK